MNHYLVYFKYSKTYDVIPKDRTAGPATVGETVVVPYAGGKKYKAIIKHSGIRTECGKRAEDSFVTASVSSTAILHSGPSSTPPVFNNIRTRDGAINNDTVSVPDQVFAQISPILNSIIDEVKLLRDIVGSIERIVDNSHNTHEQVGSEIRKVRQATPEILDRLLKKPASRDIKYVWIPCNTFNTIQTESENSLVFIRKVERELFKYEKDRHLSIEERSAEDMVSIEFNSLKLSLLPFHPYFSIFAADSLVALRIRRHTFRAIRAGGSKAMMVRRNLKYEKKHESQFVNIFTSSDSCCAHEDGSILYSVR